MFQLFQIAQMSSSSPTTLTQIDNSTVYLASSSPTWIINLEASDHMTENKCIVSSLDSVCSFSYVILADGSTSTVQGIEIANAISSLSLSFILYVPNFPFSL